jgi:hypothetical protein
MSYQNAADIHASVSLAMSRLPAPDDKIRLAAAKKDALCRQNYPAANILKIRLSKFAMEHGLV